jgi:hypothetical protein
MERWRVLDWPGVRRFRMPSRLPRVMLAGVLFVVAMIQPAGALSVRADDLADLPELGAVVLDDPLTATGVLGPGQCQTGRDTWDFVPEGFRTKITGRCSETSNAGARVTARRATVGDGEVAIDVTLTEGVDRARISLYTRAQPNGDGYRLSLEPGRGRAELRKVVGETAVLLAERTDRDPIPPGGLDASRVACRRRPSLGHRQRRADPDRDRQRIRHRGCRRGRDPSGERRR